MTAPTWGEWLRPKDAAAYTGLSRSYLYQLASAQVITTYKRGRATTFKKSELDAYMEGGKRESIAEEARA